MRLRFKQSSFILRERARRAPCPTTPSDMRRYEVGSQRVTSANRLGRAFPERSLLLSDGPTRPTSARFQLPLPEPCRLLSQHTALQGCGSTCLGLSRSPPHPLGFVHPPLRPFPLSWALPQAFEYYCRSATMRVSPFRWSHRLASRLVPSLGCPVRWVPRSLRVAAVGYLLAV